MPSRPLHAAALLAISLLLGAQTVRAQDQAHDPTRTVQRRLRMLLENVGPTLTCSAGPRDECNAMRKPPTEPFGSCAQPAILLKKLYVRLHAQAAGVDLGDQPALTNGTADCGTPAGDTDALCLVKAMVPRMRAFYQFGFDMAPGGGAKGTKAKNEDGWCSECPDAGGPDACRFSKGGYQGPNVANAFTYVWHLYRDFGQAWDDPVLDADLERVVANRESIFLSGEDNSLYFNQFTGASTFELGIGEQLCNQDAWHDGADTTNERFRRVYTKGPREAGAVHYDYHNFHNLYPLLRIREPRFRRQAEVLWDAMATWYAGYLGDRGATAWVQNRNSSGDLWCGKHCNVDLWPFLSTLFGVAVPLRDAQLAAASTTNSLGTFLQVYRRPPDPVLRLQGTGDLVFWTVNEANQGNVLRNRWNEEIEFTNAFPIQCYWTHDRRGSLCIGHGQGSLGGGAHFGANLHLPEAINGQVTWVDWQAVGPTFETDKLDNWGNAKGPLTEVRSGPDVESFFVAGPKGMGGIRLFEPRRRPCQQRGRANGYECDRGEVAGCDAGDGSDCLQRSDRRVYSYRPRATVLGGDTEERMGAYTCDENPAQACTRDAGGRDTDAAPHGCGDFPIQSCNNWRAMRIGRNYVARRSLGRIGTDDVVERASQFTFRDGSLTSECRPGEGGACADNAIPGYYDREVSVDDAIAGSLWWVADDQHFGSLADFLAFLESRDHRFWIEGGNHTQFPHPDEVEGSPGYAAASFDVLREGGSDMRQYLDFWSDRAQRHGTRRVCVGASHPDCEAPTRVDKTERAGEFAYNQGWIRAWRPGQRQAPLAWWDFDGQVLWLEDGETDLAIDLAGAHLDVLPRVADSPRCAEPTSTPGRPQK